MADVSDEAKAGAVDASATMRELLDRVCELESRTGESIATIRAMVEWEMRRDAAPAQRPQADPWGVVEAATGGLSQREAQRRSFAFGNASIENPSITREMIDDVADKLAREGRATHVERAREAMSVLGDALEMIAAGDAADDKTCATCGVRPSVPPTDYCAECRAAYDAQLEARDAAGDGLSVANFSEGPYHSECQIVRTGSTLGSPAVTVYGNKQLLAELRTMIARRAPERPRGDTGREERLLRLATHAVACPHRFHRHDGLLTRVDDCDECAELRALLREVSP